MELRGTVRRIIYEDDGFFIFTVQERDNSPHKAKGTFITECPYPGQEVVLNGDWEQSARYGATFVAKSLKVADLDSEEGLKRYLAAYVDGIGPVVAGRLVDTFGQDTLRVLTEEPERLEEVPRMTKPQREALIAEWSKFSGFRKQAIALLDYDLTPAMVRKAYETWGDATLERIQANPYCLTDLPRVGFVTADKIAIQLGVPLDSPYRIQACIVYALESAEMSGHLWLLAPELIEQVYGLITQNNVTDFGRKLSTDDVRDALLSLREEDKIVIDDGKIYRKFNHLCEAKAAEMLAVRVGNHDKFQMDIPEFIDNYESSHNIRFSEEQRQALLTCQDNRVLLLTGLPGTGKTTLTKAIVDLFDESSLRYALMSPTGIAAKKLSSVVGRGVGASTIHRALMSEGELWGFNQDNKLGVDAVIVDEFSMVDQEVFYRLLSALRDNTILIMVGDHAQLPSVGAGNVLHDLIRSGVVPRINLTQIFRQEEASDIILNAHRINEGQEPVYGDPTRKDVDFRFLPHDSPEEVREGIIKIISAIQRNAKKDTTFQVLSPRWKGLIGVNALNELVQDVLNPLTGQREAKIGFRSFREGDRVIVTKNHYPLGIYNGEIGTLVGIDTVNKTVNVRFRDEQGNRSVPIPYADIKTYDLLKLAFCITIHKSQGLEYDYVVMPFTRAFNIQLQRNLLYTAVTRAKKKVFILGEAEALLRAVQNDSVKKRNTYLAERLRSCLGESSP